MKVHRMKELLTVCLVTYNAEKWIEQCIESILAQTDKDFNLLIVNDGSTDGTEQIIKSFSDVRIRYIYQEHKNFAVGANKAISLVETEFLVFIGSDDFLASDYLEKMINATVGFPDIDYFYPDHLPLVDKNGKLTNKQWVYEDYPDNSKLVDFLLINEWSPVPAPGSLIRKSLFDRVGVYDEVLNSEDFVFLCKNAAKMRFKRVDKSGNYFYRKLKISASTDTDIRKEIHKNGLKELWKSETDKPGLLLCSSWENCWLRYYKKYFEEKYEVKTIIYGQDATRAETAMEWADIVLFNWSDGFLDYWSNQPKMDGKRHIAFLRSYEIWDTQYPWRINWDNVDHLIFVNPLIRDCFLENVEDGVKGDFNTPTHVIPNAIDLDEWKFIDRKRNKKISWVNDLSHKKGIQLLTQFAFHMPYNYSIFPAGGQGDIRRSFYFEHITIAMRLKAKIAPVRRYRDIQQFLSDKSYALSTSVVEGHPNALLEAMAVGIRPIIHNWPGALGLFPGKYVFNTIDEAVAMLEGPYNSTEYRDFVEKNYSIEKVYPKIEELF